MSAIRNRLVMTTVAIVGSLAALGAVAGPASAAVTAQQTLAPGQSFCVHQYAQYQVRATGTATQDGARFKILRNGAVVYATPGRVNAWTAELRSIYGNFPGAGIYAACAYNTGTRNTSVTLNIYSDGGF